MYLCYSLKVPIVCYKMRTDVTEIDLEVERAVIDGTEVLLLKYLYF